ncbi:MAG TPA: rhomboid family intramembrane serine protease, partial [Longimicrobiaceae bacterium]|nr:rhomboid family intramembrane serine protease [Longimicrobiaceae bacterium]
ALRAAGGGAMFGAFVSGNGYLILPGSLVAAATALGSWRAVKCPRCGYNLSWHSISKLRAGAGDLWLATVEECPKCHFRPSAQEPVPGRVELVAPEMTIVAPPPPSRPWAEGEVLMARPPASDYGYLESGTIVTCTREEQAERFGRRPVPPVAWTPAAGPTRFENIPELMALERERRIGELERAHYGPLAFLVVAVAGMLLGGEVPALGSGTSFFLGIGAILLGVRLYQRHAARRLDAAAIGRELDAVLHAGWLRLQKAPLTRVLAVAIAAVFAAQLLSPGESAMIAGMLPAAVMRGEWWRLLSYGVMHAHILHLGLNLMALLSLAKLAEVHAARPLLPLVFLVTVITGGLAGLAIGPDIPMVGASGGLLGLIGFLTVMGFRRREQMPQGFARTMLMDVGFVAATGLVGFRFIANAGHLGGLLGGLALGLLLIPKPDGEARVGWRPSVGVAALGWASLAVLLATCVATAVYLFVGPS